MADTTHNLKIKATLDASGIQSELDRLNQQNRGGDSGGGQGARNTARLLTRLDQTLSRLNRTLESLARGVQQGQHAGRGYQSPMALAPRAVTVGSGKAAVQDIFRAGITYLGMTRQQALDMEIARAQSDFDKIEADRQKYYERI